MSVSVENILLQDIEPRSRSHVNVEAIRSQVHIEPSEANFLSLYQYATVSQLFILIVSTLCSMIAGAAMPLVTVVFGALADEFINGEGKSSQYIIDRTQHFTVMLVAIGKAIGSFATTLISTWGFNATGEQLARQFQQKLMSSVLQQNIAYFDIIGAGELIMNLNQDINLIQDGISQKVGEIISGISGFVVALICAFISNRQFASIMIIQPISLILLVGTMGFWLSKTQRKGLIHSVRASNLAQEVLGAMRNVIAYRCQERYAKKYHETLQYPSVLEFRERLIFGVIVAGSFAILHLGNGLGFWQGERLIRLGQCTISDVLTILYATAVAGGMLCQALPFVVNIMAANEAASRVFSVIDRVSAINPLDETGAKPHIMTGVIRFEAISFAYPSRLGQTVLDNVSFEILAGDTVALVGPSGSGKTTILTLLERMYHPMSGQITIDDTPITELNINWLRSRIGYVSQEVTLFNSSIHSNIAHGLPRHIQENLDAIGIQKLVVQAAETARIHSFITDLPHGYNTVIGTNGLQLSGGQRQRLVIARAIISQPAILLLDEATAALDSQIENEVQEALNAAVFKRTTIIVAHRLSTIRKADRIIVMDHGKILSEGSHTELMQKCPLYEELVRKQELSSDSWQEEYSIRQEVRTKKQEGRVSISIDAVLVEDSSSSTAQPKSSIKTVWALNRPEALYISAGVFFSVLAGATYPIQAIFFGNGIISILDSSLSTGGHHTHFWARMYLIHACIVLLIYCCRGYFFAVSASRLNIRVRSELFKAFLLKPLSFFEEKDHSTGALVSILSSDATKLVGLSGTSLGLVAESTMMMVTGIAIGCIFGWKIGLAASATVPAVAASGFLQYYIVTQVEKFLRRDTSAVAVAHEAFTTIRTVTVLGLQESFMNLFQEAGERDRRAKYWVFSAIMYACTTSLRILGIAFVFWYGGTHLIATGEYNVKQFFICFAATVWGTLSAATLFSYAPDIAGAHAAARRVRDLIEIQPIQSFGSQPVPSTQEELSINQVSFKYPTRPTQLVLDEVSFEVPAGSFVALVGSTGSGKSSVINLIEQFYTADSGAIKLAHTSIEQYFPDSYRGYLALVDQNPCLVGDDLRECLQSGERDFSDEEIQAILESVGLEDFVSSLPQGLNTSVLGNGSTLSGGQRQRMAIAKALLLRPNILLMDEATSALDTSTEQLVQQAVRDIMRGRTTISIAHRLKTIMDADEILVFDHGRIIERGSHDELIRMEGKYWQMASLQTCL
ncbi:ABC transporter integral membrane type 1 [Penicillium taxi]|uniref:ABC transporter integral membrane type 1 n=1 Tax=Penicillium taxi TaxID=168475 RepID=UPI002544FF13|nr:ABC transporter integral membrane type 1 [Penicillium taxi]KAJ5884784.1 ABC transporter integral membrane type 1 [Penicillium taxi]